MIPLILFIHLIFPVFIQARFFENDGPQILMSRIRQRTVPVTEYMAGNIARHSPSVHKRGLIGDIKEQLKEYIGETYTNKASDSFEPIMSDEMDNALNQYYRYTKRDVMLTPAQERHRQLVFADWLSKRIDAKFKNHMVSDLKGWINDHKLFGKKKHAETGVRKRYFERTPKNEAISFIVSGFLLVAVFANPFAMGIWGILLALFSTFVFFTPIMNRVAFGTWT